METSDSDYFESADEDVISDGEGEETIKANLPKDKEISQVTTQLKNLQTDQKNTENTSKSDPESNKTDDENVPNIPVVPAPVSEPLEKEKPTDENVNKPVEVQCKTKGKGDMKPKLGSKIQREFLEAVETQPFKPKAIERMIHTLPERSKSVPNQRRSSNTKRPECAEKSTETIGSHSGDVDAYSQTGSKPSTDSMNVNVAPSNESLWEDSELDWGNEDTKNKENEVNMWDNDTDEWETVDSSKPQESQTTNSNTWGSWGNWGVSSIITSATQSVTNLTQAISTAMDVPDPEELARASSKIPEKIPEEVETVVQEKSAGFALGSLVMGVTKFVEETGNKVISGGLDTLETIGKKTMEVLQEGDPGLKRKRAFLKIEQDKPVLSQLLREAKEKAETENRSLQEKHYQTKAKNYETLFDDHQGLVHLEALEMLSKQCDIKLETLQETYSESELAELKETMEQVKELCELPVEDDDEHLELDAIKEKLREAFTEINVAISYTKLIDSWEETQQWLDNLKLDVCDERELHQQAIETLAQLTAMAVELFHKIGELLLVKEHRSTADEADSLVQITTTLSALIGLVAGKFSDKLNAKGGDAKNNEQFSELIRNVFFEAANSSTYIQDAFELLLPVIQVGAI